MPVTQQQVLDALKELTDPNTRQDFVTSKSARNVTVEGDTVSVDILLGYPAKTQIEPIRRDVVAKLKNIPGVANVNANVMYAFSRGYNRFRKKAPDPPPTAQEKLLAEIRDLLKETKAAT